VIVIVTTMDCEGLFDECERVPRENSGKEFQRLSKDQIFIEESNPVKDLSLHHRADRRKIETRQKVSRDCFNERATSQVF
jgi:hypothetical protein